MKTSINHTLKTRSKIPKLEEILKDSWSVVVADKRGKALIGMKYSKIELTQMGVILVFDIKQKRQPIEDAPAVYLLTPTIEHVGMIINDIRGKLYKDYKVCFLGPNLPNSNVVTVFRNEIATIDYRPNLRVQFDPLSYIQITPTVVSSSSPSVIKGSTDLDLMGILSVINAYGLKPSFFHTKETLDIASAAMEYVQLFDPNFSSGTMDTLVFIVPWIYIIEDLLTPQWTYGGYLSRKFGLNELDKDDSHNNNSSTKNDPNRNLVVRESSVYFPLLDKPIAEVGEKAASIAKSYIETCNNIHESLQAGQGNMLLETASTKEDIDTHSKLLKNAFASFDKDFYFERYRDGERFFDGKNMTTEQLAIMDEDERISLELQRYMYSKQDNISITEGMNDITRERIERMKLSLKNIMLKRTMNKDEDLTTSVHSKTVGGIADRLKGLVGSGFKKMTKKGQEKKICTLIREALILSSNSCLKPVSKVSCVEKPKIFVWICGFGSIDDGYELSKCFKDTASDVIFGASRIPKLKELLSALEVCDTI